MEAEARTIPHRQAGELRCGEARTASQRVYLAFYPNRVDAIEVRGRGSNECAIPWRSAELTGGEPAIGLANDVGDTFRSHLRGVLATRRYLAMIAGPKCFRPAVSVHGDLTAQNHDAHVEVVRMDVLYEARRLAAMNHLKALAAQVALKRLARKRPAVTAAAGHIGDALGADMLGMHAVGGYLTTLPGAQGFRIIIADNGDLAAKDKEPGVEIVAVIGCP